MNSQAINGAIRNALSKAVNAAQGASKHAVDALSLRFTEAKEEFSFRLHYQEPQPSTGALTEKEMLLCGFFLSGTGKPPVSLYEGINRFTLPKQGGLRPLFGRYSELEAEVEIRVHGGDVQLYEKTRPNPRNLSGNETVEIGGDRMVFKLLPAPHRRTLKLEMEESIHA